MVHHFGNPFKIKHFLFAEMLTIKTGLLFGFG